MVQRREVGNIGHYCHCSVADVSADLDAEQPQFSAVILHARIYGADWGRRSRPWEMAALATVSTTCRDIESACLAQRLVALQQLWTWAVLGLEI